MEEINRPGHLIEDFQKRNKPGLLIETGRSFVKLQQNGGTGLLIETFWEKSNQVV